MSEIDDMFGGATVKDVSLPDQLNCVEREIEYRDRVYARWILEGRMSEERAARELLCMRAVLETLRKIIRTESAVGAPLDSLGALRIGNDGSAVWLCRTAEDGSVQPFAGFSPETARDLGRDLLDEAEKVAGDRRTVLNG